MSSKEEGLQPHDLPLEFAAKTFNTAHPSFRFWMSNSFPGKVYTHSAIERLLFNFPDNIAWAPYRDLVLKTRARYLELGSLYLLDRMFPGIPRAYPNRLFDEIWRMSVFGYVKPHRFESRFKEAWREINEEIPASKEVFENRDWMNDWIGKLNASRPGTYFPGWVSMEDGAFLYWAVRVLKPKCIVQTGVCNGLSSAFMVMAMERNGGEGKLYAIDFPYIYDPEDPDLNLEAVYGVIIPEGKTSGWIVPESLRDRYEVIVGMAEEELPPLLRRLGRIDLFYHDSDHSYDHMTFEMEEARKHLGPGTAILCDDVAWNQSTWDFAKRHRYPAYNYRGAIGAVFL